MTPSPRKPTVDLANFYRLQNQVPEAEQVLQIGIAANPAAIPLYIQLASVLDSQDKKDDAGAIFDKLRKQVPNSSDAAMAIGDLLFPAQANRSKH